MPHAPWIKHAAGLLAGLALAGCAQKPAQAAAELEKDAPMTQTQPPQGGEAAAQAVAELLDRIAEQSSPSGVAPGQPASEPASLPAGPSLASSALIERTLKLIDGLKSRQSLRPEQIGRALDLPLAFDGSEHGAWGALAEGGTYGVWVNDVYHRYADDWTVRISMSPPDRVATACPFSLDILRRHLSSSRYSANEGVLDRVGREHALYRSKPTPEGTVFVVSANVVRLTGADGTACIEEIQIDATITEDGA